MFDTKSHVASCYRAKDQRMKQAIVSSMEVNILILFLKSMTNEKLLVSLSSKSCYVCVFILLIKDKNKPFSYKMCYVNMHRK